ncbi:hypothetical protein BU24DRAFT_146589 [Aaosphaeria arxii CBS 175.79]|uniref:Uncharacterized protein n=1 Tax=Aaosphaeria arxii CBS 175.79 TaxID=1450172 RepID=A0A6A5XWK5_9PLEO|nr:uncharacterized protein BU24DRAFT_146589 [Aaosphaeria arxii CBS 175.79]KAF2017237.1 hypothetical protein BU24DRAFT_146589 [Aaosphaeria arxii CBS 175.79]
MGVWALWLMGLWVWLGWSSWEDGAPNRPIRCDKMRPPRLLLLLLLLLLILILLTNKLLGEREGESWGLFLACVRDPCKNTSAVDLLVQVHVQACQHTSK